MMKNIMMRFYKIFHKNNQTQRSGDKSINFQAGRDILIHETIDEDKISDLVIKVTDKINISNRNLPTKEKFNLNFLRKPVTDFVDRTELSEIRTKRHTSILLVGLFGMGGVGKSELARKYAEEILHSYPDGHFEFDLNGASKNFQSPTEIMVKVLNFLKSDLEIPSVSDDIRALFLAITNGKKILFLFDNVYDIKHIEALLPPPTCGIIITSRQKFYIPKMTSIDVGKLNVDEASALANSIASSRNGFNIYILELLKLCDGLALAIRIAASMIVQTPAIPVGELILRIKSNPLLHLSPIEAIIQTSVDFLPNEIADRFYRLFIFKSDFNYEAANGVWTIFDPSETEEKEIDFTNTFDTLNLLNRASLVEIIKSETSAPNRYNLHDLCRVFGENKLSNEEKNKIRTRFTIFYYKQLQNWHNLMISGTGLLLKSTSETNNIENFISWLTQAASPLDADYFEDLRLSILSDLGSLNRRLLPFDNFLSWYEFLQLSLTAAKKIKSSAAEARIAVAIGSTLNDLGRYSESLEFSETYLENTDVIDSDEKKVFILANIGNSLTRLGYYGEALEIHMNARDLHNKMENFIEADRVENSLGDCYFSMGKYDDALHHFTTHLANSQRLGRKSDIGNALGNIGSTLRQLGFLREALEYQKRHLVIAKEENDFGAIGRLLGNVANAYNSLGEFKSAMGYANDQLEYVRELGDSGAESDALCTLGAIYLQSDIKRSIDYSIESMNLAKTIGKMQTLSTATLNLCVALVRSERTLQAVGELRTAIAYFESKNFQDHGKISDYLKNIDQQFENKL